MAKVHGYAIGPINGKGVNKTEAMAKAVSLAAKMAERFRDSSPKLVTWRGMVSMVYPAFCPDTGVQWAYSAPRTLAEIADGLRPSENGYYPNRESAYSAALGHLIQREEIPDPSEWPEGLNAKDADNLRTLRQYRTPQTAA